MNSAMGVFQARFTKSSIKQLALSSLIFGPIMLQIISQPDRENSNDEEIEAERDLGN